jgi:hypothetical protein
MMRYWITRPQTGPSGLLGNRAQGTNSSWLIYHQILLGAEVSGWLTSSKPLSEFYQNVRAYAVHGSILKASPSSSEAAFLLADVRMALDEYHELCRSRGFVERSQLLAGLRASAHADEVLDFLQRHDPKPWKDWTPPAVG